MRENHRKLIIKHLLDYGHITYDIAREKYNIHRLSARIFEIRNHLEKHDINGVKYSIVTVRDHKNMAIYTLKKINNEK